jgi:hypothetical protein
VVGANKDKKVEGKKADVILAAYNAIEAALRLLKPDSNVSSLSLNLLILLTSRHFY